MPLTIIVPGQELYDSSTNEFVEIARTSLTLEHSLLSISKWESKYKKAYLSREPKTTEELIDYIRCMTITPNVPTNVYRGLTQENYKDVIAYIEDNRTATTFSDKNKKSSREIVTSEIIYYWMTALNIPFEPCQKWHLSRLLTLIDVCAIKNAPPKKMKKGEALRRQHSLNEARKAKYHTRG